MATRPWKKHRLDDDERDEAERARDLLKKFSNSFPHRILTERQWPQDENGLCPTSMMYSNKGEHDLAPWYSCNHIVRAESTAASLREDMEILNAIACCEGFDPVENPAFWRQNLAIDSSRALYPMTRATLARYRVFCRFETDHCDPPRLAAVFAAYVSPSYAPAAAMMRAAAITEVHKQLRSRPNPLPLEIEIYTEPTVPTHQVDPERFQWNVFRRTLFHLNRIVAGQAEERNRVPVRVAVGSDETETKIHRVDHDAVAGLHDVVCLPFVMLTELHCHVENDRESIRTPLSDLMRELARVDSLRAMSWRFEHANEICLAAIGSAVSKMLRLQYVALTVDDLGHLAATYRRSRRVTAYYQWMLFALATRERRHAPPLSLRMAFHEPAARLFQQAMENTNYLVGVLPDAVVDNHSPVCLAHGTTASLIAGATLTTAGGSLTSVVATLDQAMQDVDVICQYESHAIVVYPGIGLVTTTLSWMRNLKGLPPVSNPRAPQISPRIAALLSHGSVPEHLTPVLRQVGEVLTSLHVQHSSLLLGNSVLRKLLVCCPQLTKLSLRVCQLESFAPLIQAYEKTPPCQISTLLVDGAYLWPTELQELLDTLVRRHDTMARTLRGLRLLGLRRLTKTQVWTLSRALMGSKRLEYLRCDADDSVDPAVDWAHVQLRPYVDQPVLQSPRSKTAAYTFLLVCHTHSDQWSLATPCLQLVVQFAAIPARRHVRWTH